MQNPLEKKVSPCQSSAHPGLAKVAVLARSGRPRAKPGRKHHRLKFFWRKFHLDCESLKTFIRLVNIGVGVQLGHVASYSGGGKVYKR